MTRQGGCRSCPSSARLRPPQYLFRWAVRPGSVSDLKPAPFAPTSSHAGNAQSRRRTRRNTGQERAVVRGRIQAPSRPMWIQGGHRCAAVRISIRSPRLLHGPINLFDKRPALIARCRTVPDVVDTLRLGRDHAIEISVRVGGHNVAGKAVTDGGLMIDLSPMRGTRVDTRHRTVWAQGGSTWKEFNRAAACHGLATTGGVVSSTGIAGLTLGGGGGWLTGTNP